GSRATPSRWSSWRTSDERGGGLLRREPDSPRPARGDGGPRVGGAARAPAGLLGVPRRLAGGAILRGAGRRRAGRRGAHRAGGGGRARGPGGAKPSVPVARASRGGGGRRLDDPGGGDRQRGDRPAPPPPIRSPRRAAGAATGSAGPPGEGARGSG